MPNFEVEYRFKDTLYNVTNIYANDREDLNSKFADYVNDSYFKDVPEDERPTDFVIENTAELKDGE